MNFVLSFFTRQFLIGAIILAAAQPLCASTVDFSASFDTNFLTGASYFIDFTFTQGDPKETGTNTAAISGLSVPAAPAIFPLIAGTPTGVSPSPSEYFFKFVPGQIITFSVAMTANVTSTRTPDLLTVYVEDSSGNPIITTDLAANSLIDLTESIDPAHPGVLVATYDTPAGNQFNVGLTQAPEPGTLVLGSLCFLSPFVVRRRRSSIL